jgi:hypothetical protein
MISAPLMAIHLESWRDTFEALDCHRAAFLRNLSLQTLPANCNAG